MTTEHPDAHTHFLARQGCPGVPEGLQSPYLVRRLDDQTGKHVDCRYFVLDPLHDPIARQALAAYADDSSCPPALSRYLWDWLGEVTP